MNYADRGQTGQKFSTILTAVRSNGGLMRFKLFTGALNGTIFIDFLQRPIEDA